MPTGLIYSDRFIEHDTGPGHPERPERLRAIRKRMLDTGLADRLEPLAFGPASDEAITAVHEAAYLQRLRRACAEGQRYIDAPDSAICAESCAIAVLAAGGAVAAVDAVMGGLVDNAFCAMRPPGHHCEADRSMGFCLLNNIAIAAEHLVRHHGLQRVAIVDFDVHHGNGTQHIFEARQDVLFISIHEDPTYLYPGTGFARERGRGEGAGFTLNLPMQPGSGDEAYRRAFDDEVLPTLRDFRPEFLLVSAGFDASAADPLAHMQVSAAGFEMIAQKLCDFARSQCSGRHVAMLEGGYDLDALADGVERYLLAMLG